MMDNGRERRLDNRILLNGGFRSAPHVLVACIGRGTFRGPRCNAAPRGDGFEGATARGFGGDSAKLVAGKGLAEGEEVREGPAIKVIVKMAATLGAVAVGVGEPEENITAARSDAQAMIALLLVGLGIWVVAAVAFVDEGYATEPLVATRPLTHVQGERVDKLDKLRVAVGVL